MTKPEKIVDLLVDPETAGLMKRSLKSWEAYARARKSVSTKNSLPKASSPSKREKFFELAHTVVAFYEADMDDRDLETYWVFAEDYDLEHVKSAFRAYHKRTGRQSRKFPSLVEFVKHIAVGTQK